MRHDRATRKGVSPLGARQPGATPMGEFQNLLDFPPAPKLNILGRLDPARSNEGERRGEVLFFGKAQCAICHVPPYYTDNLMHNLRTERFFKESPSTGARPPRTDRSRRFLFAHQGLAALFARRSVADTG